MLVKTLVELGAIPKKRTGPSMARTPSEKIRVRREQVKESQLRRAMLLAEAERLGLPPPVVQRGRPRKYDNDHDRLEAKRAQFRIASLLYKDRIRQGVESLKANLI